MDKYYKDLQPQDDEHNQCQGVQMSFSNLTGMLMQCHDAIMGSHDGSELAWIPQSACHRAMFHAIRTRHNYPALTNTVPSPPIMMYSHRNLPSSASHKLIGCQSNVFPCSSFAAVYLPGASRDRQASHIGECG